MILINLNRKRYAQVKGDWNFFSFRRKKRKKKRRYFQQKNGSAARILIWKYEENESKK